MSGGGRSSQGIEAPRKSGGAAERLIGPIAGNFSAPPDAATAVVVAFLVESIAPALADAVAKQLPVPAFPTASQLLAADPSAADDISRFLVTHVVPQLATELDIKLTTKKSMTKRASSCIKIFADYIRRVLMV